MLEDLAKELVSEGRHHPLGNKPWKKKLHHQECALDNKLEEDALMEEKKERRETQKNSGGLSFYSFGKGRSE